MPKHPEVGDDVLVTLSAPSYYEGDVVEGQVVAVTSNSVDVRYESPVDGAAWGTHDMADVRGLDADMAVAAALRAAEGDRPREDGEATQRRMAELKEAGEYGFDYKPGKEPIWTQNEKLNKSGIASWGIPAWMTPAVDKDGKVKRDAEGNIQYTKICHNAGECGRDYACYAQNGTMGFPAARLGAQPWRYVQTMQPDFVSKMDAWVKKKGDKFVRVHDSGDFYSLKYLKDWYAIAEANPDKQFYAYTKMVSMAKNTKDAQPKNWRWIFSFGGKEDKLIQESDFHSVVFDNLDDLAAAGYVDNSEDDEAAAWGTNPKIGLVIHNSSKAGQSSWRTHAPEWVRRDLAAADAEKGEEPPVKASAVPRAQEEDGRFPQVYHPGDKVHVRHQDIPDYVGTIEKQVQFNKYYVNSPERGRVLMDVSYLHAGAPYTAPAEPKGTAYKDSDKFLQREGLYNGKGAPKTLDPNDLTKPGAKPMPVNGPRRIKGEQDVTVSFKVFTNAQGMEAGVEAYVKPDSAAPGLDTVLKQAGFEQVEGAVYDRAGENLKQALAAFKGAVAVSGGYEVVEEAENTVVVVKTAEVKAAIKAEPEVPAEAPMAEEEEADEKGVIEPQVYQKTGTPAGEPVPKFADGGYPLYYFDMGDANGWKMGEGVVCPKCVNTEEWSGKHIVDAEPNYEDPDMYCENCNERIPSAYAEDNAPVGEPVTAAKVKAADEQVQKGRVMRVAVPAGDKDKFEQVKQYLVDQDNAFDENAGGDPMTVDVTFFPAQGALKHKPEEEFLDYLRGLGLSGQFIRGRSAKEPKVGIRADALTFASLVHAASPATAPQGDEGEASLHMAVNAGLSTKLVIKMTTNGLVAYSGRRRKTITASITPQALAAWAKEN